MTSSLSTLALDKITPAMIEPELDVQDQQVLSRQIAHC